MTFAPPICLASASPRRRELLEEAGIDCLVHPPDIDDGRLRPGAVTPRAWVVALAYLKARRVAELLAGEAATAAAAKAATILAADTVCVRDGVILGQPRHAAAAAAMLRGLRDRAHEVLTGVCLIDRGDGGARVLLCDRAVVRVGMLPDEVIDAYVASAEWRGKAGAYNLADRIAAGWPITCSGDPTSVMGLPMRRLRPLLGTRPTLERSA